MSPHLFGQMLKFYVQMKYILFFCHWCDWPCNCCSPNLSIKVAEEPKYSIIKMDFELIVCLVKFCQKHPTNNVHFCKAGSFLGLLAMKCLAALMAVRQLTVLCNTLPPKERSQHHADVWTTAPPIKSVWRAPLGRCSPI